jgi:hypothetical protein
LGEEECVEKVVDLEEVSPDRKVVIRALDA